MTTPRAIAAGAVVGFCWLELAFSPTLRAWCAIAAAAAAFGFSIGYSSTMAQLRASRGSRR